MILAQDNGVFEKELAPVTLTIKKKEIVVREDEHPRPQTTLEGLNKLPSVFQKDGLVTAGTASVRYIFFFFHKLCKEKKKLIFFLIGNL